MNPVGFLGLGTMGEPMALNLLKGGFPLVVWNRTPGKTASVAEAGAAVAANPDEVFGRCVIVLAMLADGPALDAALGRGTPDFQRRVKGRLLVNMATIAPAHSKGLGADLRVVGASYVEAPVSGSRKPAEAGQLVAMLAGEAADLERIRPILAPMCREMVDCGTVPKALLLKMTTNLFQISMITAYAEAANFAVKSGLSLELFNQVVLAGQMASALVRVKAGLLERRDFAPQAAIRNVCESNRLAVEAAEVTGAPTPLSDVCLRLNRAAMAQGLGDEDMIAVLKAYEAMTR